MMLPVAQTKAYVEEVVYSVVNYRTYYFFQRHFPSSWAVLAVTWQSFVWHMRCSVFMSVNSDFNNFKKIRIKI